MTTMASAVCRNNSNGLYLILVFGIWFALLSLLTSHDVTVTAFQSAVNYSPPPTAMSSNSRTRLAARRGTIVKERTYDPIGIANSYEEKLGVPRWGSDQSQSYDCSSNTMGSSQALTALSSVALMSNPAIAKAEEFTFSGGKVDPSTFQPVCPTADGVYRLLQASAEGVIGTENAKEYGPLIAGGLLRVRLELCVVESFFNEAVGPFIERNGFSWILPLHETVETFVAGTVFALTATFILIGSTKIVTVIVTYADFLLGFPSRLFGGFFYDRALGRPVTLDVGIGPFKTRVIGPPDDEEIEVDLVKKGPINFLVIIISGVVKVFGQVLGVSLLSVVPFTVSAANPLAFFVLCVVRFFVHLLMHWTCLWGDTWLSGRLDTF